LSVCRKLSLYDQRLPLRPGEPELEFAVQREEITSTEQLQQVRTIDQQGATRGPRWLLCQQAAPAEVA
jgi:hypothetical protein